VPAYEGLEVGDPIADHDKLAVEHRAGRKPSKDGQLLITVGVKELI